MHINVEALQEGKNHSSIKIKIITTKSKQKKIVHISWGKCHDNHMATE